MIAQLVTRENKPPPKKKDGWLHVGVMVHRLQVSDSTFLDSMVWFGFCFVLFRVQTQKSLRVVRASACLNTFEGTKGTFVCGAEKSRLLLLSYRTTVAVMQRTVSEN